MRRSWIAIAGAVAMLALSPPRAAAGIWREIGDAGNTVLTAQTTTNLSPNEPLTAIIGSLGNNNDVDVYKICVMNAPAFSATTVGLVSPSLDTKLYLFNASGLGVYANDDANDSTLQSTLPANNPLGPQTDGIYFLAISSFERSPSGGGQLIFPNTPLDAVVGPTGPGGGHIFDGDAGTGFSSGPYTIALTGACFAAVPEPASVTLMALGCAGVIVYLYHQRTRRQNPRTA